MEWGDLSAEEQAEVAAMDPAEFNEWSAKRQADATRPREGAIKGEARGGGAKNTMTSARTLSLFALGALVFFGLAAAAVDRNRHSVSPRDAVGFLLFVASMLALLAFIVLGVVALVERHRA
jgi:hypothetical protein